LPAATDADRLVAAGDEASLRAALELQPDHPAAVMALAEQLVDRGGASEREEALALLARLPETPESRRLAARARVPDQPGDEDLDRRLAELLERAKDDEEARREFLDLLEVLGAEDPRTPQLRRALASRLY
jgi:putative thioredoxin